VLGDLGERAVRLQVAQVLVAHLHQVGAGQQTVQVRRPRGSIGDHLRTAVEVDDDGGRRR
jgi:hypothetical protein